MLLVPTLREDTTAHVTLDTMEMDSHAIVNHIVIYLVSNANIISDVVDIDECFEGRDTCHSNATCMDTDGSFECTCDNGFTGDGYNCSGKSYLIFPHLQRCVISL